MRPILRRFLYCASLLGLLPACQHQPEWRRRADVLLRDSRFPRPGGEGPACLTDALLAEGIRAAVGSVGFGQVADFGPLYGAGCSAMPTASCAALVRRDGSEHPPQMDLSVIAFNNPGCAQPVAKATVVFDRTHPGGFVANHDERTQQITNIRFRKWDEARWNGGRWVLAGAGEAAQPQIVPGTEKPWQTPYSEADQLGVAPASEADSRAIDFLSPWPASVFKTMVGTYVMKVVDRGQAADGTAVDLSTPIELPSADLMPACPKEPQTLSLRQALETMLQWSGNCATAALIRFLHAHQEIIQSPDVDALGIPTSPPTRSGLNELLADLGLSTMQMNRTIARSGRWGNPNDNYDAGASVANNHMNSWDTARLFWLLDDLPDALQPRWEVAPGRRVDRHFITEKNKAVLREILADSYSGSALAGNRSCPGRATPPGNVGPPPALGIPARLSPKWLLGSRLHSPLGDHPYPRVVDDVHPRTDDSPYSADLSRCQNFAEVQYLNKAGLTNLAGSSVGIVRGLADRAKPFLRHYIVSFFSTLGTRYTDPERLPVLASPADPLRPPPIATTQTVPRLGATLDAWLALWLEADTGRAKR
jgi:hypothetical protein